MRKKWPGFTLVLVASLLTALFVPARALADPGAPAAARDVSVSVTARNWVNTGVNVTAGQELRITAAGTWTDGSTTSGPNGSAKLDADNFFNTADLGVCNDCHDGDNRLGSTRRLHRGLAAGPGKLQLRRDQGAGDQGLLRRRQLRGEGAHDWQAVAREERRRLQRLHGG